MPLGVKKRKKVIFPQKEQNKEKRLPRGREKETKE